MTEKKVHSDVVRYGMEEVLFHICRGDLEAAHQLMYVLIKTVPPEDRTAGVTAALKMDIGESHARVWAQATRERKATNEA